MKKLLCASFLTAFALGTPVALACGNGTPGISGSINHWFVGYDISLPAGSSVKDAGGNIVHGANNSSPDTGTNTAGSVWTMLAYQSGFTQSNFEQTGIVSRPSTNGEPAYVFAMQDNNGYHEFDSTYGPAVGSNHDYEEQWAYNGSTDTIKGLIDGNTTYTYSSTSWNIPNDIQNAMEELSPTTTPGIGYGSSSKPEKIEDPYYWTNSTTVIYPSSLTDTFDQATQECLGSNQTTSEYDVYDNRN